MYSLSQQNADRFDIDPVTGVVTVGQSLSAGQTYNFQIVATDKVMKSKESKCLTLYLTIPTSNDPE